MSWFDSMRWATFVVAASSYMLAVVIAFTEGGD